MAFRSWKPTSAGTIALNSEPVGGAYGDPQARRVGDVAHDELNGKVRQEAAQHDYGVTIEGAAAGPREREGTTR